MTKKELKKMYPKAKHFIYINENVWFVGKANTNINRDLKLVYRFRIYGIHAKKQKTIRRKVK